MPEVRKYSAKRAKFIRSMSENDRKKIQFFRKKNPQKCSFGHVECSFDNPAEIFSTDSRKIQAQFPKMKENFFQKIYLSSKCSSGHIKCNFDKYAENFPSNFQKTFAQCPKMIKKFFSKKIIFIFKMFLSRSRMQF